MKDPDYPRLAKIHHGIVPWLQQTVPGELIEMFDHMDGLDEAGDLDDVRRWLFSLARTENKTAEGALCRFALYEGIRLNVWVQHWTNPEVEARGGLVVIDELAQGIVAHVLNDADMLHEDVEPMHVLVGAAMANLDGLIETLREAATTAMERIDGVVAAAQAARDADVRDAIIIRNDYEPALVGDEPLGSRQLSERHPQILKSAESVDQRASRMRRRGPRPARGRRMIDLVTR